MEVWEGESFVPLIKISINKLLYNKFDKDLLIDI